MKIDALASNEIHETGESSKMPFGYARIWRSSYQQAASISKKILFSVGWRSQIDAIAGYQCFQNHIHFHPKILFLVTLRIRRNFLEDTCVPKPNKAGKFEV